MFRYLSLSFTILGVLACKATTAPGTMGTWYTHKNRLLHETQAAGSENWAFRGLGIGKSVLNVFDFDHTIADTTTQVPVTDESGRRRMIDSKCLVYAANEKPDYTVFDNENVYMHKPISAALQRLREYTADSKQTTVILTARSSRRTLSMLQEYLWQRGAEPDLVLAANHARFHKKLWSYIATLDGEKKPLIIASLIESMRSAGNPIVLVRYFEDTDKYLAKAMAFLPELYPEIRFEFYDYIREKNNAYREVFVAYSDSGRLYRQNGEKFADADAYSSGDCPER